MPKKSPKLAHQPSVPLHLQKAQVAIAEGRLTPEQYREQELKAFHLLPEQGERPSEVPRQVLA